MKNWMTLGEYFGILYKILFKSISFTGEVEEWPRRERLRVVLWTGFYNLLLGVVVISAFEAASFVLGFEFDWFFALREVGFGVGFGVAIGVAFGVAIGVGFGVAGGVAFGVAFGVGLGVAIGVAFGVAVVVAIGVAFGVALGVAFGVTFGVALGVALGVAGGVAGGVAFGIGYGEVAGGVAFGVALFVGYFLETGRYFYYPFYWKGAGKRNPVYWDENIVLPVPWFSNLLLYYKREEGIKAAADLAIFLTENRPIHRKAAQRGLLVLAADTMERFASPQQIAQLPQELAFMPPPGKMGEDYDIALRELSAIAEDVQLAWEENNLANRLRLYKRIRESIADFQKTSNASRKRSYVLFRKVGKNWLQVIGQEIERLEQMHGKPLPNPFITGPPVQPEDGEVFVGRSDIIQAIQTETLREGATGAILFTGGRRTGKSSTLLNLNRFLPSSLRAVYFDCQSPKMRESLQQFCRHLAGEISQTLPAKKKQPLPQKLTELTEWLEAAELALKAEGCHVLICIDEYERLGSLIQDGTLRGLADALRSWVQRFRRVTFLFAGSHELRELSDIDWSDYLINVRTVYISYLDEAAALKLVTKPVPEFDLEYKPGTLPRQLTERLGRQPYLLQCTMSEMVENLNNNGNRKLAEPTDIDHAVTQMFITAGQYFEHFWEKELEEDARELLLRLAKKKSVKADSAAAKRLVRKEVLRRTDGRLTFCVPVLQEWVVANY